MTKRELVVRISEETGLTQQQVFAVVQKTLDYVTESLVKGETVEFRDFGVFEVKVRKPRIGRNPNKPETDVIIPTRAVVKFKAGKVLKAQIKQLDLEKLQAEKAANPSTFEDDDGDDEGEEGSTSPKA